MRLLCCCVDRASPDNHPSISAKGTLAMKVHSTQERFYEALAPLGKPDLRTKTSGTGRRPSRISQLKDVAEAVGRWSIITSAVALIHVATLKYLFWLI
jgi:hypothetical protein